MVEAAAERADPDITPEGLAKVRAMAAATDNVGVFFGEDIFLAVGVDPADQGVPRQQWHLRDAVPAVGLGDSDGDCGVPGARLPAVAARPAAAEMIGLSVPLCAGRADVRRLCGVDAGRAAHPKRWGSAAFWGLLALSFLAGDWLGDLGNGVLVLALVALAGTGQLGRGKPPTSSVAEREASAAQARQPAVPAGADRAGGGAGGDVSARRRRWSRPSR